MPPYRIGTRSSRLALLQTEQAIALFRRTLPSTTWETLRLSSPGDRDKQTDLSTAPADFFTRDLDEALLEGRIDGAIHSAKDLPDSLPEDLDAFWLPDAEDPRDVVVGSLAPRTVGVSSVRRTEFARRRFPDAECKPLRGTIEERLSQLDAGAFDAILMAAAALQRLGLKERISEWIDLRDLSVPEGQGALALTFRRGDERILRLRSMFLRPVVFVGAGIGPGRCTQEGIEALRYATRCLHDALLDPGLLKELPGDALRVPVGKRCGEHSVPQEVITAELIRLALQGERVVRLKGGDPGIFGRLAEETDALDERQIPYRIVPGVSSLTAATTGTGLLLTRRGVADRFRVFTAHTASEGVPGETAVAFMGIRTLPDTVERMMREGMEPEAPAAVILDAGGQRQRVVCAPLSELASTVGATTLPGVVLAGESASGRFLHREHGALRGCRIWLSCSQEIQSRAARAVCDYGGQPLKQPLIELVPEPAPPLERYDWILLTSPSAVRSLLAQMTDLRTLPRILCCGKGTAASLAGFRIRADAMPGQDFSTEGVLRVAREKIPRHSRICRFRSDRAGTRLSEALQADFPNVDDVVICRNHPVNCDLPSFDAVLFASVSAVDSFFRQFGPEVLTGKDIVAIGAHDAEALRQQGDWTVVVPRRATVEDAMASLASWRVQRELESGHPETRKGSACMKPKNRGA